MDNLIDTQPVTNPPASPASPPIAPIQPAPPSPGHRTAPPLALIIILSLMAGAGLMVIGTFAYQYFSLKNQSDRIAVPPTAPTPSPAMNPGSLTTNPIPADWKTFTLTEIGLEFKLPPKLTANRGWDVKKVPGETGFAYCFAPTPKQTFIRQAFAGGAACAIPTDADPLAIGTTSVDFVAGRSGWFNDYQGYEQSGTTFLAKFVSGKTADLPPELVTKITNHQGVEILKITGKDIPPAESNEPSWPVPGTPGSGYLGALINTGNAKIPGLTLSMKLGTKLTEAEFDQILSTFKFTASTKPPTTSSSPKPTGVTNSPGKDWTTFAHSGLNLSICLPPKWEFEVTNGAPSNYMVYARDPQYRESVGQIYKFPYHGGSRREEFIDTLIQYAGEDPGIKSKASVQDVTINGKSFLNLTMPGFTGTLVTVVGNSLVGVASNHYTLSGDSHRQEFYTIAGCLKSL